MKKICFFFSVLAVFGVSALEWNMAKVSVVMPKKVTPQLEFAQKELDFHLGYVAGKRESDSEFKMFLGKAPKGAPKAKADESLFVIDGKNIYFYGDDGNARKPKNGTLLAIYTFFRKYYGLRYTRPGNDYIIGRTGAVVNLPDKETVVFKTKLELISLRTYGAKRITGSNGFVPQELRTSESAAQTIIDNEKLWRLRNRLASRHRFKYGHAFRDWQKRFLKTNPEYFGLSPYGTRGLPRFQDHLAKLCLSNEAVVDQIISDWVKGGKPKYLNLCPNDGTPGYCFCDGCRKLDADLPGERFHSHKTDRYLNFWNRITAKAREIRPDVKVIVYIYSYYRFPPRREKIQFPDNTICGVVPGMTEDLDGIFKQWQAAGMKECFFRPNFLSYPGVLPRGLHRHFYNTFKKAAVFNFIGADYDAIPNRRPSDLDFYVIARLLDDPDAVFDDIINEYCSVYGKAADTVKAYYAGLAKRGEAALFATTEKMQKENLSVLDDGELGKYAISGHTEKDLAADINLLKEGLKKELSPAEKTRLNALIICAEHYLHSFRFMRAGANGKDIEKYGKTLHDFRIANKDVLNENFGVIYSRTEKSCWAQVEFYNKFVRKSNFKAADPCAGWRESFDGPGLAKWQPRKGYVKVTDKTASFDKYSVELKPNAAKGDTIGIWRRAVPVTPSGQYTLTFDFKFDGVSHGGIRVAANGAKRTTLLRVITKDNGSNFWQSTQKSFKVPADCTSIDMYVFIGKGSESSRAYIDNIQLTRK